jgi:hypothetical protein
MNDYAIHKALESKGIDLEECHFNFSQVNSPTGVPHNEEEFKKVIWMDHDTPPVTWAEVVSAGDTLDAEYDAQEYARKREVEYPSIQECIHAILDDDLTALQEKRQAVKTKYPKS